ncbi:MAG TPA: HEXXH motif-containing putative peptide modification protein, partial [Candidatus Polarisedimenticolia bacterium]|nr:HEXXH motif-containing putative peptide modification protein [Candidatus Polarisedimenticolia bacterium]
AALCRVAAPAGARRTSRHAARASLARPLPEAGPLLAEAARSLRALPAETRTRVLCGPDLRGFLGEMEIWVEVDRLAAAAGRGPRRGIEPIRTRAALSRERALERLFDRISRTEHLVTLVPAGRIDEGLPARASRFARRRLREALADLAAFLVGLRLAFPSSERLRVRLTCREEPEQGRPSDRIDLGTLPGAAAPLGAGPVPRFAGPLAIVAARSRRPEKRGPQFGDDPAPGQPIVATLTGGTLTLRSRGSGEVIFPAAGSRLRFPAPRLVTAPGRRPGNRPVRGRAASGARGGPFTLVQRETIPGSSILLAPAIDSRPRRLRVGRPVPGLGDRLARALRLVRLAWPEGYQEIVSRTWMVAPIRESRLVSYSLVSRPGISFINVFGKTVVDLADDLLHETAHHRLHDIQEIADLLVPGPATHEVQAFDSPWRRSPRPLHGILHGAYTFLFRAELLRRLQRLSRARPRLVAPLLGRRRGSAWLRREIRSETAMLARALRDLGGAARTGLLTPAGRGLLREMRGWLARQRRDRRVTDSLRERAAAPGRGR